MNLVALLSAREVEQYRMAQHFQLVKLIYSGVDVMECYQQRLSSFFPMLGSIEAVIILGFAPCGGYMISFDENNVRFHFVISSRDQGCKVAHQFKSLIHSQAIPLQQCYIEVASLISIPEVCVSLTGTQNYSVIYVLDCKLRVFIHERLLVEIKCSALLGRTQVFDEGIDLQDAHDQLISVVVNSGERLLFVYAYIKSSEILPCVYLDTNESPSSTDTTNTIPAGLDAPFTIDSKSPVTSSSASKKYHLLDHCDVFQYHTNGSPNDCIDEWENTKIREPQKQQHVFSASIHGGNLSSQLMLKYFPQSLLMDYEMRSVGPDDVAGAYLIVVSVQFNKSTIAKTEMQTFLLHCRPWQNIIGVLRFCDLEALPLTKKSEFQIYSQQQSIPRTSLLAKATDYYCFLLQRFTVWSRYHVSNMSTLSNVAMVRSGDSIRELRHPYLPLVIYNDEDDDTNDRVRDHDDYYSDDSL